MNKTLKVMKTKQKFELTSQLKSGLMLWMAY